MSELDVHVQKCLRCRWEITLSGRDAYERCLVAWVAHVAALHPDEYLDARKTLEERWAVKWARQWRDDNRRHEQWLCAEEGHSTIEYGDGRARCTHCEALITVEWLKGHYEAQGHEVKITEDGKGIIVGSGIFREEKPPTKGETPDVVLKRLLKTVGNDLAPVLQQLTVLVGRMLEPPAEHRDHLRDKLGEPPENRG